MSKFSERSFGTDPSQAPAGTGGGGGNTTVDWDVYNKHISDAVQDATGCGEKSPVPVVGIISGIVDCGMREYEAVTEEYQKKDPSESKANGFRKKMVENGKGELSTVDGTEMITYTPTKAREVLYFVDFPSITVDKGQFFADSNPAPYRVMIGGVFGGQPARPVKVTGYPKDNHWYCGDGSYHVKLAKAAGIPVKDGFRQDQLLELIGKPLSFNVEVFINAKGYLQEKVSTPNRLMAGIPVPEYNDDLLFYVGFYDKDNDAQSLKFLPKVVKAYMKQASNYEGSVLEGQLTELEGGDKKQAEDSSQASTATQNTSTNTTAPNKPVVNNEPEIDFDTDIPFAPIGLMYNNSLIHVM